MNLVPLPLLLVKGFVDLLMISLVIEFVKGKTEAPVWKIQFLATP